MYKYEDLKPSIFTEDGQKMFLSIRDKCEALLEVAGCFTMGAAIRKQTGDSWKMLACVDRLLELKEIREIKQSNNIAGQDRIFTK